MIRFELLRDRGILVIEPEGPLEKADFERLASEADPLIASAGKLAGLLIHTKSFPGWRDFGAFISHLKFVAGHHRQIKRIAIASDAEILAILPRIADHFLTPEIKQFAFAEKDRALAWIESGGVPS